MLQADYWKDFEEPFEANDFAVIEREGRLKFFVFRSKLPVYDTLVLSSGRESPGYQLRLFAGVISRINKQPQTRNCIFWAGS